MEVGKGEICIFLGPSGCGKTLMINKGGYSKPKMEKKGKEEGLIDPETTDSIYKITKNKFSQTASFSKNGYLL